MNSYIVRKDKDKMLRHFWSKHVRYGVYDSHHKRSLQTYKRCLRAFGLKYE